MALAATRVAHVRNTSASTLERMPHARRIVNHASPRHRPTGKLPGASANVRANSATSGSYTSLGLASPPAPPSSVSTNAASPSASLSASSFLSFAQCLST